MTPARWQQVSDAFAELGALDEVARAARLAELGRDDPALRDELIGLLDAAGEATAEGFLERPPVVPGDLLGAGVAAGDRLGPYELLEELGRGGMGTVHRARRADGAFTRDVAIKVISRGLDSERVVRRFLAERDILAALEHPNIARLLDGGQTGDGRPYFVMELVNGLPLDRWVGERAPPLARRLEVFLALCEAVQRAHRSLVIHRDLKPANVLVGDDGVPRLLDFGIAKLLVPGAAVTRDDRAGTPAYASPEQVRGEPVTTATDVHGLGLLLFVLLTGRPAFDGDGPALARAICETPAPLPSAVAAAAERAALRGDLDTIVAMALRKEPERRYGSVAELADDVRRHLAGQPVRARGDGALYRSGRFVRRHWLPLAAGLAVVGALAGGLVATRRQAEVARRERATAERRLVQVRELASALVFEVDDAIRPLAGATSARRLVVERALFYLDALAAEGDGSVALARELVAGYRKLGDTLGSPAHANLGDTAGAEARYRQALAVAERWQAQAPGDVEAAMERARLLDRLGALRWAADDLAGAAALGQQAIDALEGRPASVELARMRPGLWASLGDVRRAEGRVADAVALYQRALADARAGAASGEPRDRETLAITLIKLGDGERSSGQLDAAQRAYEESLAIREALAAAAPDSAVARRDVSSALSRLVKVHKQRGDLPRALEVLDRVLALDEAAVAAAPDDAQARRDLASTVLDGALLLDARGAALPPGPERRAAFVAARARFVRALALFTEVIASGGGLASDATLPDGIRARIRALDDALAQ